MLIDPKQIRGGVGGGGTLSGTATVNLPDGAGVLEWRETVAKAGILPADAIGLFLAPALDTDENDPELLDLLTMSASAGTDRITINMTFLQPTSGPIKLIWKVL